MQPSPFIVDRAARDRMAELTRWLCSGRLTNDAYEAALPLHSRDPAIWSLFWEGTWELCDDFHEHRLVGKYRLEREAKRDIGRLVLFLKSDLPYEWPNRAAWEKLLLLVDLVLTHGLLSLLSRPLLRRIYASQGPIEIWPFYRRADYERALARPPYLCSRSR